MAQAKTLLISRLGFAFLLLFSISVHSAIIELDHGLPVNQSMIYGVFGGNTYEFGNSYFQGPCRPAVCDVGEGMNLAVGDTVRIRTSLSTTMILTDLTDGPEFFRGFFLRSPFPNVQTALDVSSIETRGSVTFLDSSGEAISAFSSVASMPFWEYEHFDGDDARFGIEHILGDNFLSLGQSMEIAGWDFEMNILADPNGLLAGSEWPWPSFGLRADLIQVGTPLQQPSKSVPESGTLALMMVGLVGVCFGRRSKGRIASVSRNR